MVLLETSFFRITANWQWYYSCNGWIYNTTGAPHILHFTVITTAKEKRNENNLNVSHRPTCIQIHFVPTLICLLLLWAVLFISQKYLFTCLSLHVDKMQKDHQQHSWSGTVLDWYENTWNDWGVLKFILPDTPVGSEEAMSLAALNKSCEIKNINLAKSNTVLFLI